MRLSYGLRMLRAMAIGGVLFLLAAWIIGMPIAWPFVVNKGQVDLARHLLADVSKEWAAAACFGWWFMAASVVCFGQRLSMAMLNGRGRIASALSAPLWFVRQFFVYTSAMCCFWLCSVTGSGELEQGGLNVAGMFKWMGIIYGVPIFLLWAPALGVLLKEQVSESVLFQRLRRFGGGGSDRWAGPASFRRKWVPGV